MKILIIYIVYHKQTLPMVADCLRRYEKSSNDITVKLITRYKIKEKFKNISVLEDYYKTDMGKDFIWQYQKTMRDASGYDLYIVSEDCHFFSDKNIKYFVEYSKKLPEHFIPGFLRYSYHKGKKYLVDMNSAHSTGPNKFTTIDGEQYFIPNNIHQGCFALTESQYQKSKDFFNIKPSEYYRGMFLESATSALFTIKYNKVIPILHFEDSLIYYMDDKYYVFNDIVSPSIPDFKKKIL